MKIVYYMPFKPMGHRNPSGDLIIGSELFAFLRAKGAKIELVSRFRCRWIYFKPHLWPLFIIELVRVVLLCRRKKPDIWLTYHSYYKAPDILGAFCCRLLNMPYAVFQGIYSTKRRRSAKTAPGFYLNRLALQGATAVFSNKKNDHINLGRLLPPAVLTYIPPGLHPDEFRFDGAARRRVRKELAAGEKVVILSAAMFRPGVKTRGIVEVMKSCAHLADNGADLLLVIVGDGSQRPMLEELGAALLPQRVLFVGKQRRKTMKDYYSAADIFAFPGIEESLGMVFLEAQACRLPVVGYGDWGAGEVVVHGRTGLLSPAAEPPQFRKNLQKLVDDRRLRQRLGSAAEEHVRKYHDIEINYTRVWDRLQGIAAAGRDS